MCILMIYYKANKWELPLRSRNNIVIPQKPTCPFPITASSLLPKGNNCSFFFILTFYRVLRFSSYQSLSCVRLFATLWTAANQASLSIASSWNLLKLMSIESVIPSDCLVLCRPLLLPPSVFPSIRVFSSESALRIRWPQSWSPLPKMLQNPLVSGKSPGSCATTGHSPSPERLLRPSPRLNVPLFGP